MRRRLDQALVEQGLVSSRSRARDAVARGLVLVGGVVVLKPGALVAAGVPLAVAPEAGTRYVSRGALKLIAALDAFGFEARGRTAFDVGASTGGFTQVLLERGAAKVYAVDVGRGQLAECLKSDPRVVSLEGLDARAITAASIQGPIEAMVADVSFISLEKALPPAIELAAPGAWLAALVKPQFEVGPASVGKGGIVRDEGARRGAVSRIETWLGAMPGWRVKGVIPSPVEGGSGNLEFLIGAVRHD